MSLLSPYVPNIDPPAAPDNDAVISGSPEGVRIGYVGQTVLDGDSNTLYYKETGDGTNTGWTAVSGGGGGGGSTNASDLTSGTLAAARLPAFTGGDVTSVAGSAVLNVNELDLSTTTLLGQLPKVSGGTGADSSSVTFPSSGTIPTTSNNLSVFSATTSAQLRGVISDETGTGVAVFNDTPTLLTPTIASFTNATHTHQSAAGGGALDAAAIGSGSLLPARGGAGAVTTLTDAATVATDASLGNLFRVTLGGNRTLGNPTNLTNGQLVTWEIIQDGTGSRTLGLDTNFAFGVDITGIALSTTPGKRDFMSALYNSTSGKLYVIRFLRGY